MAPTILRCGRLKVSLEGNGSSIELKVFELPTSRNLSVEVYERDHPQDAEHFVLSVTLVTSDDSRAGRINISEHILNKWNMEARELLSHSMAAQELLKMELRKKDSIIRTMRDDLEEDKKSLLEALDKDIVVKLWATKIGLVNFRERQLDKLYNEVDLFINLERDGSRMKIELLENENAYLKLHSELGDTAEALYEMVETGRIAQLQQKVRELEDEVLTATMEIFVRSRQDAEIIHDLEESCKIQQRFSTARQDMDKDIRLLEETLDMERNTSQDLRNEVQSLKGELEETNQKLEEKRELCEEIRRDFENLRNSWEEVVSLIQGADLTHRSSRAN